MVTVAVVGGGFAGVYAIKELHRAKTVDVLLFEPRERFVFTPLLHEVAADVLHSPSVTHPYDQIFNKNFQHIRKRVTTVDVKKKHVYVEGREKPYGFDYLILAHGSRTRVPKDVSDVLELKGIEDALTIRRRIEQNVRDAAQHADPALLRCVIVGGGPTGVELAAELIDFYKDRLRTEDLHGHEPEVYVLQSRPELLPHTDKRIRTIARRLLEQKGVTVQCDCRVTSIGEGVIVVDHGSDQSTLEAGCVIWTAGVVPNDITAPGVQTERGRFRVEDTLQLEEAPHVYSVGDVSHMLSGPLPDLAQVAVQQGTHAGKNILRQLKGQTPRIFSYHSKGFLVSLGQRQGAGVIGSVFIKGFLAWFIWRTVYLLKFVGVRSKLRMAAEYTRRLFRVRVTTPGREQNIL